MPKPYPREFREDVVNVARNREPGQTIKQIAADFGIAESCLRNWMHQADVDDGGKTDSCVGDGVTAEESPDAARFHRRNTRAAPVAIAHGSDGVKNRACVVEAAVLPSATSLRYMASRRSDCSELTPRAACRLHVPPSL
ncbi:MAG: transposase [Tomitella sp.]|nr:transposase [Tomitella sp.]